MVDALRHIFSGKAGFLPVVLCCAGAGLLVLFILTGASFDFAALTLALFTLTGLLVCDIHSRKRWERDVSEQISKLSSHHDRLVREVARNRNEIAALKEGLGETAAAVAEQGRRLTPSGSAEARMIETMVENLGAIGIQPRAKIGTEHDANIMELEMAPPPRPANDGADFSGPQTSPQILEILRDAVRNDRVDIAIQPVVSLPQRKPKMIELFARVRVNGSEPLSASRYLSLARREGLLAALDNHLLLHAIEMIREREVTGRQSTQNLPYMMNISVETLNDKGFMGDLATFLSQNAKMAEQMIFEFRQEEFDSLSAADTSIMEGLHRLGCRFAIDNVRARRIDINKMKSRHIRFMKIDAAWLLREGASRDGFSRIVQMKKHLDAAGVDLIVERIEDEATLRELLDYSIDFGQGYLFARPDSSPSFVEPRKVG